MWKHFCAMNYLLGSEAGGTWINLSFVWIIKRIGKYNFVDQSFPWSGQVAGIRNIFHQLLILMFASQWMCDTRVTLHHSMLKEALAIRQYKVAHCMQWVRVHIQCIGRHKGFQNLTESTAMNRVKQWHIIFYSMDGGEDLYATIVSFTLSSTKVRMEL